jgi:hypothetical protein
MIKIAERQEDFRIYVENDKDQYISSRDVLSSEKSTDKRIPFRIKLGEKWNLSCEMTREEIKSLTELLNEVIKYL